MNFEPQKFFVGLVDFFSILLPGALLTYVIRHYAEASSFENYIALTNGAEGWAIFLFVSYLLGHFIFLLGSLSLDDSVYDKVRGATLGGQIRSLAKGSKRAPLWLRKRANKLFKSSSDVTLLKALAIKEHYLEPLGASNSINAFQWCKAKLSMEQPAALFIVQRFEADSKFFRSLLVVLLGLIGWWTIRGLYLSLSSFQEAIPYIVAVLATIPFVYLALWRYVEQRAKAVTQAYRYILILEAEKEDGYRPLDSRMINGVSQVFCIVFRQVDGKGINKIEYLLNPKESNNNELVLPSGQIKPGENLEQTAVRNVLEQAGVWASVEKKLKGHSHEQDNCSIKAQYFILKYVELEDTSKEEKCRWLSLEDALKKTNDKNNKLFLKLANQKLLQGKK